MCIMQIPDSTTDEGPYMPREEGFQELTGITQEEVWDVDISPMLEEGPQTEIAHPIRVAILGLPISNMLDFRNDERVEYFVTGTAHDLGKLKVANYYPEKNPYRRGSKKHFRFIEKFKLGHVDPKNIAKHWGMRVASAIEGTHFYQNGTYLNRPYPQSLLLPRTPESELLSKIVAIPDFIDALASRPCKKTGNYRNAEEVVDLTMKEYGDLIINYRGNIYTKVDTCGREIIQELHKRGFIGGLKPENISEEDFRMNPFRGLEIK